MKLILLSLVLSVVPPWVSAASSGTRVKGGRSATVTTCSSRGHRADAERRAVVVTPGAGCAHVEVQATARAGKDGRSEPKAIVVSAKHEKRRAKDKDGDKSNSGYLGVSVDRVPTALAEQLDLDDRGVIIAEVVEGSPAEKAGIEAHDILLSFDGKSVEGDLATLTGWIKGCKPGAEVAVTVLRRGKEKSIDVTVGGRAHEDATVRVLGAPGDEEDAEEDEDDHRGFLGVMLEDVPAALAAHLDLDDRGVIVVNVLEGGPADKGGLEVYDVVIARDGEAIKGGQPGATAWIGKQKPGDSVTFKVLRKGKERTVTVTLGTRGALHEKNLKWKSDRGASAEWEEKVHTNAKMLRKGPSGEWMLQDLGEIHELEKLPKQLRMFVPKSGERATQISVEGGKKKIRTKFEEDGRGVIIEQEGDGAIKVTRRETGGKETTHTYADAEALRKDDEEAADLYEELGRSVVVQMDGDSDGPGQFAFNFKVDTDDWAGHLAEWQENMDDGMREAAEAYHEAMEEFHDAMRQWSEAHKGGKVPPLPKALFSRDGVTPLFFRGHPGKPRQSFEVGEDGKIEVRIRKGDSEVVRVFENEKNLKERDEELYGKYEQVMKEGHGESPKERR